MFIFVFLDRFAGFWAVLGMHPVSPTEPPLCDFPFWSESPIGSGPIRKTGQRQAAKHRAGLDISARSRKALTRPPPAPEPAASSPDQRPHPASHTTVAPHSMRGLATFLRHQGGGLWVAPSKDSQAPCQARGDEVGCVCRTAGHTQPTASFKTVRSPPLWQECWGERLLRQRLLSDGQISFSKLKFNLATEGESRLK